MCSYLQWAEVANLTLKFNPTDEDNDYCLAFGDSKLYSVSYGLSELWKLGSYDFLNQLATYADQLKKTSAKSLPKFIHYAAHAETLAKFFDGLGIHRPVRTFPSSALIIEFFVDNHQLEGLLGKSLNIRLNYYDGETQTEEVIRVPTQTEDHLTYESFRAYIQSRLDEAGEYDVEERCQDTEFTAVESDYYTGEQVITDLKQSYTLKEYFFESTGFLKGSML